jgi:hypothetical protein
MWRDRIIIRKFRLPAALRPGDVDYASWDDSHLRPHTSTGERRVAAGSSSNADRVSGSFGQSECILSRAALATGSALRLVRGFLRGPEALRDHHDAKYYNPELLLGRRIRGLPGERP